MLTRIVLLSAVLLAGGCSYLTGDEGIFRDRKKDYQKAEATERMVVPEGLDSSSIVDLYPVPPMSPYAEQELIDKPPFPTGMMVDVDEKVRLQRLGDKEWLLVQMTPSQLWPRLREYMLLNQLQLLVENGRQGTLIVTGSDGFYHFRVEQGFQHNQAELAVRHANNPSIISAWPAQSLNADKENEVLLQVARFLAESEKPAYSYAAHNISTEQRLLVQYDAAGNRYLLLKSDMQRVKASLVAALTKGEFVPLPGTAAEDLRVMFAPQSDETREQGFWAKLFRLKPKLYDDSIEFAGNEYQFTVTPEGEYLRIQASLLKSAAQTDMQRQKELNQQLMRIKGLLN